MVLTPHNGAPEERSAAKRRWGIAGSGGAEPPGGCRGEPPARSEIRISRRGQFGVSTNDVTRHFLTCLFISHISWLEIIVHMLRSYKRQW